MKVTLISSHRDTTCKRKQKRVKEEVPSWRGVTHSQDISNWNGDKNDAGLSNTATFVMFTALILYQSCNSGRRLNQHKKSLESKISVAETDLFSPPQPIIFKQKRQLVMVRTTCPNKEAFLYFNLIILYCMTGCISNYRLQQVSNIGGSSHLGHSQLWHFGFQMCTILTPSYFVFQLILRICRFFFNNSYF